MKVNIDKLNTVKEVPSFEGYKPSKTDAGTNIYEFNYPFDSNKFDCYLELCQVVPNENTGNYELGKLLRNKSIGDTSLQLQPGVNKVNLNNYSLNENSPFAYHYKLTPKGSNGKGTPMYQIDSGDIINFSRPDLNRGYEKIYNLVVPNGSKGSTGGSQILLVPDSYNAMYTFDKDGKYQPNLDYIRASLSMKHFSNKMGGSLAGVEHDLDAGKFDGLAKIVSTPLFTDDSKTPHAYWNKNCMQIAQALGSVDDYARLQRKLFAHGINWVSDGAYVNEGLEGVHFKHVLKWGEKSPYFYWFNAENLQNGPLSLGVYGKKTNFIAHKLINCPWDFEQSADGITKPIKNKHYDKTKPTYLQIFDRRLVSSSEAKNNTPVIENYSKCNTENIFDIVTHDDTVVPYVFEIDPDIYMDNIKKFNEYNKAKPLGQYVPYESFEATRILTKFPNFQLESKFESGFTTWDANVDIAKLRYVYSHNDTIRANNLLDKKKEEYKTKICENNMEVQDYAITSAQYWTRKSNQILNLYVAKNLQNVDSYDAQKVNELIQRNIKEKKTFPVSLNSKINLDNIECVLRGQYQFRKVEDGEDFKTLVKSSLMDVPLDSIELGDNIVSVLGTSYMSKRAHHPDEIGKSRYKLDKLNNPHLNEQNEELYRSVNAMFYEKDDIEGYKNGEFYTFAMNVLKRVNEMLPPQSKLNTGYNTSDYRKYVVPLLAPEIMKFAMVKGLFPDAETKINEEDGGIKYDYKELKETSLQALGIHATDPKQEATELLSAMKKGIASISKEDKDMLAKALYKMIENTNLTSFRLAEMIVDRSQAGMDWRIDATKDIGDIDALRDGHGDFQTTWNDVINFWSKFSKAVYEQNPNSYLVAEVTDEDELFDKGNGKGSARFNDRKDIVMKFLRETGITSTANYRYFFTDVASIFGKTAEKGDDDYNDLGTRMIKIMKDGWDGQRNEPVTGFLHFGPLGAQLYSYTFVDNHDKPRILHALGMDMGLFYANLKDKSNQGYREAAYRVFTCNFNDPINYEHFNNYKFDRKSPKAAAMGDAMQHAFSKVLDNVCKSYNDIFNDGNRNSIYEGIVKSISELANGISYSKSGERKEFNADAFGVIPYDIAINKVIEQAENHGLRLSLPQRDILRKSILCEMLRPALPKMKGMMQFLVAAPGNPTVYAGDDFGMTGYEQKTKNIYLQNRNALHHEWLENGSEGLDDLKNFKKQIDEVMAVRSRYELHPLNDGAPFLLPEQHATTSPDSNNKNYSEKLSAILRQSTDGAMTISLFNTRGITHNYKDDNGPKDVYLDAIELTPAQDYNSMRAGITPGVEFVNAKNENERFVVKGEGDHYYLVPKNGGRIHVDDYTMILYYAPEEVMKKAKELNELKQAVKVVDKDTNVYDMLKKKYEENRAKNHPTTFTGGVKLYNPQYNIVANPYIQSKNAETGSRLALLSR